jgi:predicted membrane channel-forming protein YqfA (hemolysin III family)
MLDQLLPQFVFIFEDIPFILQIIWWLVLLYLAFYFYSWAQEHLPFSPLFALVVGIILIYFLVIEHPIIGLAGVGTWILISSGVLYLVGMFFPWIGAILYRVRRGGKQVPPHAQMPQQY